MVRWELDGVIRTCVYCLPREGYRYRCRETIPLSLRRDFLISEPLVLLKRFNHCLPDVTEKASSSEIPGWRGGRFFVSTYLLFFGIVLDRSTFSHRGDEFRCNALNKSTVFPPGLICQELTSES